MERKASEDRSPKVNGDSATNHNISSGDVTVNSDNPARSGDGPLRRVSAVHSPHNIPYMQLFHHLKQKFPDLKDCDINESIQKVSVL